MPVLEQVLRLVGERAEFVPLEPRGTWSAGGATQLLEAADGWIAVSLARPSDVDAIPAWLHGGDLRDVNAFTTGELVDQAALLGLPVAAVDAHRGPAVTRTVFEGTPRGGRRVVDLSGLWAGPLCGRLLAEAGFDVVKVESHTRPDGARLGSPEFFARLNDRKQQVSIDLPTELPDLLRSADIVIESSRPRALEQMGIDACDFLRGGVHVWCSITAYGRDDPRVGFGDDAAVAGGLVKRGPAFLGDAIADPLTGLRAATAILDARKRGEPCLLDISLAGVAREVAGPTEE